MSAARKAVVEDGQEEARSLVLLRMLPGLPDRRLRELLERNASASVVLERPARLGDEARTALGSGALDRRLGAALDALQRLDVRVVGCSDEAYPSRLRQLHDPPPVLFMRGRMERLRGRSIAIVGSRRHTQYGADTAKLLGGGLAAAGVTVVSGLALGIDAAAHEAALPATIAVLGCGIDVDYPRRNARLQDRIASVGLLVSEFPPGQAAMRYNFPKRNRLIAALSEGVIVVEASAESGSLITVDHAIDLGREIFAVPGPIRRETSEGTNALLRDGARVVTSVSDVLEELRIEPADVVDGEPDAPRPEGAAGRLWDALEGDPVHIDRLAAASGMSATAALVELLELELGGRVRQLPGKRFQRVVA